MAVNLSPIGNGVTFTNTVGTPLIGGFIYTYQAGSSTPLSTYTSNTGAIANSNPIVLGTDGRTPSEVWLTEGYNYKFVLTDSSNVTIATYDNIYGILGSAPSITPIPTGAIMLWSGSVGSIPAGYYLCNGQNGTPNLQDKFVIGAGNSYGVGASANVFTTGTDAPAYYALCYIQKA